MFGDRPVLGRFGSRGTSHQSTARASPPEVTVDIESEGTSATPVAPDVLQGAGPELKPDSIVKGDVPPCFKPKLKPDWAQQPDVTVKPDSYYLDSDRVNRGKVDTKKASGIKSNIDVTRMRRKREQAEAFAIAVASAPAIETAVTVKPTELLAIGAHTYGLLLAEGVRRRLDEAVAVLRATNAMVSIPYEISIHVFLFE